MTIGPRRNIYRVSPLAGEESDWTLTVLHGFALVEDGFFPKSALTMDSSGVLYGTTSEGGHHGTTGYDELFAGWGNSPLSIEVPDYGSTLPAGLFDHPKDRIAGAGDARVQACCFRLCLPDDTSNSVPWAPPPGYDADEFVLSLAALAPNGDVTRIDIPDLQSALLKQGTILSL